MSKSIYSNDGEIRIYIRKNKHIDTIQLIHGKERKVVQEKRIATKENIAFYKKEGLKAWNKLIMPKEVREVETLTDFYLTAFKSINRAVREDTADDRIRRFEKYVLPYLGNIRIEKLKALQVEEWQTNIIKLFGANQARRTKQLLKSVLDRGIVYELIESNVVTSTTKIREPKEDYREVYSKDEVRRMLDNSTGQLNLFILTMFSLGLRSGEVVAIRYSDINFKDRTIKIQRSIRKGKISLPKTGVSRVIEVPTDLISKLEQAYENYKDRCKCYTFMTPPNEDGYIFTTPKNKHYNDCSYITRRQFKPLLERIGVKYKTLYSLRHTYATLSIQGGQSLTYVSKQLGHADTRTTLEYYTKYLKDKESIKRADKILSF